MSATVTVVCEHCQRQLKVPEAALGKRGKCPACKNTFTAVLPGSVPAGPPAEPAAAAPKPAFGSGTAPKLPPLPPDPVSAPAPAPAAAKAKPAPPRTDEPADEDEPEEPRPKRAGRGRDVDDADRDAPPDRKAKRDDDRKPKRDRDDDDRKAKRDDDRKSRRDRDDEDDGRRKSRRAARDEDEDDGKPRKLRPAPQSFLRLTVFLCGLAGALTFGGLYYVWLTAVVELGRGATPAALETDASSLLGAYGTASLIPLVLVAAFAGLFGALLGASRNGLFAGLVLLAGAVGPSLVNPNFLVFSSALIVGGVLAFFIGSQAWAVRKAEWAAEDPDRRRRRGDHPVVIVLAVLGLLFFAAYSALNGVALVEQIDKQDTKIKNSKTPPTMEVPGPGGQGRPGMNQPPPGKFPGGPR
jgi:hypothetical protein